MEFEEDRKGSSPGSKHPQRKGLIWCSSGRRQAGGYKGGPEHWAVLDSSPSTAVCCSAQLVIPACLALAMTLAS